jgi:hypothetical protein
MIGGVFTPMSQHLLHAPARPRALELEWRGSPFLEQLSGDSE